MKRSVTPPMGPFRTEDRALAAGQPAAHLRLRLVVARRQQLVQQPHRRLDLGTWGDLGLQNPEELPSI
ncbi:hypothetical protein [Streptomyces albus]|uniref:hypothetical protein n=1 Tax=Streptomyces albus TaxID=1888 RepID=UPI003F1A7A11